MILGFDEIFADLRQWPHRGAGSEQEMEAREALMARLTGQYQVEVAEEAFWAPKSYLPFFWLIALGTALMILGAPLAPGVMLTGGALLFLSHFLFFDWRESPLIWLGARTPTANLVARKGAGRRLIILMAHLDSAPASFAYRADQVRHFGPSVILGTAIVGLGMVIPFLAMGEVPMPLEVRLFVAALPLVQAVMASIDFWRFGYTPGANDNLTGVACATEVASRLWAQMPPDSEVRLVITTAEEAGMLGAQHYWRHHREELKARETHVLNIDTVGQGNLGYVTRSGGFTPVRYDGPLVAAAGALVKLNPRFAPIRPTRHKVGDFDSVWFNRDGISALTLAAYDADGLMPYIHTPEDRAIHVDPAVMAETVAFAEALIRLLPTVRKT